MMKRVVGVIGAAACVVPALGDVVFSDANFNPGNWGFETIQTGNGGTSVASQVATGNPGTARELANSVNAGPAGVFGFSRYGTNIATRYDPATQGAIASVDFGIDYRFVSGVGGQGHGLQLGAKQGSFVYAAAYTVTGSSGVWGSYSALNILDTDFTPLNGGPAIDFSSSGAFIRFGFIVSNSTIGGPYSNTVDYDNFAVTVHQVPAPAAGLALFGLAGVAARRRR